MAGKGKPGPKERYNWSAIETEYVTGNISYADLAQKHGVSNDVLTRKAIKRNWTDKKQQFKDRMLEQANKKRLQETVLEKIHFDMMCEQSCDLAVSAIQRALIDYIHRKETLIDSLDMLNMAKAMQAWQDIKYRSLGVPAPKQVIETNPYSAPAEIIRQATESALTEISDDE